MAGALCQPRSAGPRVHADAADIRVAAAKVKKAVDDGRVLGLGAARDRVDGRLSLCNSTNVEISFDPAKREKTLAERGLDFADAAKVFAGPVLEAPDMRKDYGEDRIVTIGFLHGRMVVVGWTLRKGIRHVFTMRKANVREQRHYGQRFEES